MHGIWKQEGMKEVKEKHWLEELEMETIKQKIEGQYTKDTEVAPVVQIVTLNCLEQKMMMKQFMEIGVRSDWIEAAELNGKNKGEELQERNLTEEQQAIIFRLKEVLKSRSREALPSLKTCDKNVVKTETSKVNNVVQYITTSNITDCNNLLYICCVISCH